MLKLYSNARTYSVPFTVFYTVTQEYLVQQCSHTKRVLQQAMLKINIVQAMLPNLLLY